MEQTPRPHSRNTALRRGPYCAASVHRGGCAPVRRHRVETRTAAVGFSAECVQFPATWSQNGDRTSSPRSTSAASQLADAVALGQADAQPLSLGPSPDWARPTSLQSRTATRSRPSSVTIPPAAGRVHTAVGGTRSERAASIPRPGGVDPPVEHLRGDDLPRRVGLRHQPVQHPRLGRAARQGAPRPARSRFMRGADSRAGTIKSGGKSRAGEDGRARRSTTPTSASSSGARPRRRTRPPRCVTPGSTCRSTATASTRSSTRTRTTRSG